MCILRFRYCFQVLKDESTVQGPAAFHYLYVINRVHMEARVVHDPTTYDKKC
jgi:hypothetical protein